MTKFELLNLLHDVPLPYLKFGKNELLKNQIKSCTFQGHYSTFGIKTVSNHTKSKYCYKTI